MSTDWLLGVTDAVARLPAPPAEQFLYLLEHGTAKIGLYAPHGTDPQGPHQRDEIYMICRGTGSFERNGDRRSVVPGDVIFVPAGMVHRFVDFADDFAAWVVFYGPPGGEASAPVEDPPG